MVKLKVKQPFLSPNLQVWSTPINSKLLITGSLGVDPYLVEQSSNYPRYSFLVEEDMHEESIEEAINKEAAELETILDVKFKRGKELEEEKEEKCLPVIKHDKKENGKHFPLILKGHGTTEEKSEDDASISNAKKGTRNHFPLIPVQEEGHGIKEVEREEDKFWSDEEETSEPEEEIHWQNHLLPLSLICSTDTVYITAEESLILPVIPIFNTQRKDFCHLHKWERSLRKSSHNSLIKKVMKLRRVVSLTKVTSVDADETELGSSQQHEIPAMDLALGADRGQTNRNNSAE